MRSESEEGELWTWGAAGRDGVRPTGLEERDAIPHTRLDEGGEGSQRSLGDCVRIYHFSVSQHILMLK